jgi:serine/threonine protein kinase/tetratricopeptide (TPR) repeat protein
MALDPKLVQDLFLRLIETPAEDREAVLDRECGSDAELRQRVESLLKAHEEPDSYLDSSGNQIAATEISDFDSGKSVSEVGDRPDSAVPPTGEYDSGSDPWSGELIAGRYTLKEKIGEGGMGEVWVAKQSEPVKRKVALKLIKTGMDSKSVLARFEQERRALGMMDHPNIARVFDGGITRSGQPFFVMELVNGLPLIQFCDEATLSVDERLELFASTCHAVQHAHQKGIVHRDLKPANILVTIVDGRPVPKVIDFGVAKATSGKLTDESLSTQFGAIVGTLEYMSPEQAGYTGDDIDTRADIFSLGVILYELLTGLRPIDASRLNQAAFTEMIRIIREEEPPKPSTRLSTDQSLPSLAAVRKIEPRKLTALLSGELDWIVMKCLEKQRDRRYETANALCRDIQRYLADEPVEARPPSAGYRLMKFVRRNKGRVIAAGLVMSALLLGTIGTTLGLIEAKQKALLAERREVGERQARKEAEREKRIALAVQDFLQKKLLGQADIKAQADALLTSGKPATLARRNPSILELLDRAADELTEDRIDRNFPDQPLVQAEILHTVGNAYLAIGEEKKALDFLSRSADIRQEELGPDHRETLTSRHDLGWAEVQVGYLRRGIPRLEVTLERQKVVLGPDDPDTLTSMENLALAYVADSEPHRALPIAEEALQRRGKTLGSNDRNTIESMLNVADVQVAAGNPGQALPLAQRAYELQKQVLVEGHPDLLTGMTTLADVHDGLLHTEQAHSLFKDAFELAKEWHGEKAPITLHQMSLYADSLPFIIAPGERFPSPDPRGVTIGAEALELAKDKFGTGDAATIPFLEGLARAHIKREEYGKAVPFAKEAFEIARTRFASDDSRRLDAEYAYADTLSKAGEREVSLPLYEEVLKRTESKFGTDNRFTTFVMYGLAEAYVRAGLQDQYRDLIEQVFDWHERRVQVRKQELGADHPDTLQALETAGMLYYRHQEPARAVPHLREAYTMRKRTGDDRALLELYPHTCLAAGVAERLAGRPEQAVTFFEEAVATVDPAHPQIRAYKRHLASAYAACGQLDKALKLPQGDVMTCRLAVELSFRGNNDPRVTREAIIEKLLPRAAKPNASELKDQVAKACCLGPATPEQLAEALKLARDAMKQGKNVHSRRTTLGMVEYHNGNLDAAWNTFQKVAEQLKKAAADPATQRGAPKELADQLGGTAAFYQAMIRFKQKEPEEAKQLAMAAAAMMKPIPEDVEKQAVWGGAPLYELYLWWSYKQAKVLIQFPTAEKPAITEKSAD